MRAFIFGTVWRCSAILLAWVAMDQTFGRVWMHLLTGVWVPSQTNYIDLVTGAGAATGLAYILDGCSNRHSS